MAMTNMRVLMSFLYGQLQERFWQDVMRSLSMSGASTYKELCMFAKNEERRRPELTMHQQYLKQSGSQTSKQISSLWKGDNLG